MRPQLVGHYQAEECNITRNNYIEFGVAILYIFGTAEKAKIFVNYSIHINQNLISCDSFEKQRLSNTDLLLTTAN